MNTLLRSRMLILNLLIGSLFLALPLFANEDGVISFCNEKWAPITTYNQMSHALYIQLNDTDQDMYDSLSIDIQGGLQKNKIEKIYLTRVSDKKGVFRGVLPFDFKTGVAEVDGDLDVILNEQNETDSVFVTYIDLRSALGITLPLISYVLVRQFDLDTIARQSFDAIKEQQVVIDAKVITDSTKQELVVATLVKGVVDSSVVQAQEARAIVGKRVKGNVAGAWQAGKGSFVVTGDITVPSESTLVVFAGTHIEFSGNYRFNIQGKLDVRGTDKNPVVFKGAGSALQSGMWKGIYFEDSASTGRFEWCEISHSNNGIYTYHADSLIVMNSRFRKNQYAAFVFNRQVGMVRVEANDIAKGDYGIVCVDTCNVVIVKNRIENIANHGISCEKNASPTIEGNVIVGSGATGITCLMESTPAIKSNVITGNSTGISCMNSSPTIFLNKITDNRLAGIVCFGSSNPRINRNSISRNRLYDLKNQTSNTIDAKENWWGALTTTQLKDKVSNLKKIYDHQDSPALGEVNYGKFTGAPLGLGGDGAVAVTSLEILAKYDGTVAWPESTHIGDRVFLRVLADDIDPLNQDEIGVRVYSQKTDPKGMLLLLAETGISTGEYRGTFIIVDKTSSLLHQVGATYGEDVVVVVANDTTKQARLFIKNSTPLVSHFRVSEVKDPLHLVEHAPTFVWHFSDEIVILVSRLVMFMDPDIKKKVGKDLTAKNIKDKQQAVRIQVSNTPGYGTLLWDSGEIPVIDSLYTYAGDTLRDGHTYYFRISVSDGNTWSTWNNTTIRLNTPPSAPVLQSPRADARISTLFPVLRVQTPDDAESDKLFFEFEVARDSLFTQREAFFKDVPGNPSITEITLNKALRENSRYYWRVRVRDSWEMGNWSERRSFYADAVDEVIRPFSLLHPDNEEIMKSLTPSLLWEPTTDPDPEEEVTYTLYLSTDPTFKDNVTVVENLVAPRYDIPKALSDNKYHYWKVAARQGKEVLYSDQTGWWFFTNGLNDPPCIRPIPDIVFKEDMYDSSLVLDAYVEDIDNEKSELVWQITASEHITATLNPRTRRVRFNAPHNWAGGPEKVRFTVRDPGRDSASVVVAVTVAPVNDLPVLSRIPEISINEDDSTIILLNNYVTDVESSPENIRWSCQNQQKFSINIDSKNSMHIHPPLHWNGRLKKMMVTARDEHGGEVSSPLSIRVKSVNDAPVIDTLPLIVFKEEGVYHIRLDDMVNDVDNNDNELSWRFWGNRKLKVVYKKKKRVLILTAPPNWSEVAETLFIRATDPKGAATDNYVCVKVSSVNDPPVLAKIPDITIDEDNEFVLNLKKYVTDVDNDITDLRWKVSGHKRISIMINADSVTALLHVKENWTGEERLVFVVTDPQGASAQQRLRVTVQASNDAPVATLPDTMRFNEDETYLIKLDNFVMDVDHDKRQLTWKATGQQKVYVTIDPATRRATLSAPQDWFGGPEHIYFVVHDKSGAKFVDSVTVIVTPVNDVPVVSGLVASRFLEDKSLTLSLDDFVVDVDNKKENLVWSATGQSSIIVTIDTTTRKITFTAPQDWNGGPEQIKLGARDPGGLTGYDVMAVQVVPVNDVPVMQEFADITFDEDAQAVLKLDAYVFDVDNRKDELMWVSTGQVKVAVAISAKTREAVFTAPQDWFGGPETIKLTCTDPDGLSALRQFKVVVKPVNDVPVISGLPKGVFLEDQTLSFMLDEYVVDVDNTKQELVWSIEGNNKILVKIDPVTRGIVFSAPLNWNGGPEKITLSARDPAGLTGKSVLAVSVTPVNDAPVMKKPANITFEEDGKARLKLDDYISDVDNRKEQIKWTYTGNKKLKIEISTTREAIFTAPQDWYGGPENIHLTGTDPEGLSATQELALTVTPVNDAPVITGPQEVVFDEDESMIIKLDHNVKDVDDRIDKLTWSVTGGTNVTAWLDTKKRTVHLSGPPHWNGGPEKIMLSAKDPGGLSVQATVMVQVAPVNDAPVMKKPQDIVFKEDEQIILKLNDYITDIDNSDAEIQWKSSGGAPIKVNIDPIQHTAIFTAPQDWYGAAETILLTGTDPGGLSSSQSLAITVSAVNDAPVIVGSGTFAFDEDVAATLKLDDLVKDIDNKKSELQWKVTGGVKIHSEVTAATRSVRFTAPKNWNGGPEMIALVVTDPAGLSHKATLQVTVKPINDAPRIKPFTNIVFEEDAVHSVKLVGLAEDEDDTPQQLMWSLTGATQIKAVVEGRTLRFTARADWHGGPEKMMVTVTDRGGLAASAPVQVTVTSVNDAPRFTLRDTYICGADTLITLDLKKVVSDIDNKKEKLTWKAFSGSNIDASVSSAGILTVRSKVSAWRGQESIRVTATDGDGATGEASMLIKVVAGRK